MDEDFGLEKLKEKMPDYFRALSLPWHLAYDLLGSFVDDDGVQLGNPSAHTRSLFLISQALTRCLAAAEKSSEAAATPVESPAPLLNVDIGAELRKAVQIYLLENPQLQDSQLHRAWLSADTVAEPIIQDTPGSVPVVDQLVAESPRVVESAKLAIEAPSDSPEIQRRIALSKGVPPKEKP